jgi:hypothetical protein
MKPRIVIHENFRRNNFALSQQIFAKYAKIKYIPLTKIIMLDNIRKKAKRVTKILSVNFKRESKHYVENIQGIGNFSQYRGNYRFRSQK